MIPTITIYNTCGCGSGQAVTQCGCKAVAQSAYPVQSMPAPALPCTDGDVPPDYVSTDAVLYNGPDIIAFGIKKGDNLTKIINSFAQAFTNIKNGQAPY